MKSVRWAKGEGSTAAGTASTLRAYWSLSPMVWVHAAEMDGVTVRSGDAGMRRSRESRCSWYAPASLRNCGGEERKGAEALPQGTVRSESQSVAGQRKGGAGGWLPTWTRVRGGPHRRRPASFTQRSVFKSPPRLSWSDGTSLLSAEGCPILRRRHRLSTRLPKDCSVASEFGQLRTKLL